MKKFEDLSQTEKAALLKFPAYISLLAVNNSRLMDSAEKKEAIKLTHIKTFSSNPLLRQFYIDAEKVFEKNITELDNDLPKDIDARKLAINKALQKLESTLKTLGDEYTVIMIEGLKAYIKHISKAHNTVIENFVFPFDIPGVTT